MRTLVRTTARTTRLKAHEHLGGKWHMHHLLLLEAALVYLVYIVARVVLAAIGIF